MRCPYCEASDTKVLDSRPKDEGYTIHRRRECRKCGTRFSTYEKVELSRIYVVKRDGRREPFSTEKIINGIRLCCQKLPVSTDQIEAIAAKVEKQTFVSGEEISTKKIGDMVMEELRKLDPVAYVRFAAVYRSFSNLDEFRNELQRLENDEREKGK